MFGLIYFFINHQRNIYFEQTNNIYKYSTWKSKGVFASKLVLLHNLSSIIKYFLNKIGLEIINSVLVVEKNSYTAKIVNFCIFYRLDNYL